MVCFRNHFKQVNVSEVLSEQDSFQSFPSLELLKVRSSFPQVKYGLLHLFEMVKVTDVLLKQDFFHRLLSLRWD